MPSLDLNAPQVDDAVGDDEFEVSADLAATGVVDVHRRLNLPVGSGPQAHRQFRADVCDVLSSAFAASAAPGTVRTYGAVLKNIAPPVSSKLGSSVLPMATVASFFSFFGSAVLLGPCSAVSSSGQPAARRSAAPY